MMYDHLNLNDQHKAFEHATKLVNEENFDFKKKHISGFEDEFGEKYKHYNKKQMISQTYHYLCREDNLSKARNFLRNIEEINPIRREDRVHDVRCEFAKGNSCFCWCGEKYHGLSGQRLSIKVGNS